MRELIVTHLDELQFIPHTLAEHYPADLDAFEDDDRSVVLVSFTSGTLWRVPRTALRQSSKLRDTLLTPDGREKLCVQCKREARILVETTPPEPSISWDAILEED